MGGGFKWYVGHRGEQPKYPSTNIGRASGKRQIYLWYFSLLVLAKVDTADMMASDGQLARCIFASTRTRMCEDNCGVDLVPPSLAATGSLGIIMISDFHDGHKDRSTCCKCAYVGQHGGNSSAPTPKNTKPGAGRRDRTIRGVEPVVIPTALRPEMHSKTCIPSRRPAFFCNSFPTLGSMVCFRLEHRPRLLLQLVKVLSDRRLPRNAHGRRCV